MPEPVGNLSNKHGRWMSSHAHRLAGRIPDPRCRWRWSDTDLTKSELQRLRDAGLIEHVDDQTWRTTQQGIQAVADYGRLEEGEVGTVVGQITFGP